MLVLLVEADVMIMTMIYTESQSYDVIGILNFQD